MEENNKIVVDDEVNEAEETKTDSSLDKEDELDETSKKAIIAIGYLWILFLIPLLVLPKNKFARFHVNQQVVFLIASIILGSVAGIVGLIPLEVFGVISAILGSIVGIICLIVMIIQIIAVVNGEEKKIPVIGNITILK